MSDTASHRSPCCLFPLRRAPASKAKSKDDILTCFGKRVRQLRLDRGFNQAEFARFAGIDRSYLSEIERGRKSVSVPMAEVIALHLGIDIGKLFKGL